MNPAWSLDLSDDDDDDLPTPDELAAELRQRQKHTATLGHAQAADKGSKLRVDDLVRLTQSSAVDGGARARTKVTAHSTLAVEGSARGQDGLKARVDPHMKSKTTSVVPSAVTTAGLSTADAPSQLSGSSVSLHGPSGPGVQQRSGPPSTTVPEQPSGLISTTAREGNGWRRRSEASDAGTIISDSEDERARVVARDESTSPEQASSQVEREDDTRRLERLQVNDTFETERVQLQQPQSTAGAASAQPVAPPLRAPEDLKKPLTFSQVIFADESDDESSTVFLKTPNAQVPARMDDNDFIDDGVLTYEPTPKARRPAKFALPLPAAEPLTPRVDNTPIRPRRAATIKTAARVAETDLSSDSTDSSDPTDSSDISYCSEDSGDDEEGKRVPSTSRTPTQGTPPPSDLRKLVLPTPSKSSKPTNAVPKSASKVTAPSKSTKTTKAALLTRAERETLPLELVRYLDNAVFRKKWDGLKCLDGPDQFTGPGLPEGLTVTWNARLRNTAGRANYKRVRQEDGTKKPVAGVDLANKVVDTKAKLKHTLSHELCHIAAWVLSGELKPPHGDAFKLWSKRVMSVRPDICITTTHTYEIAYKYRWQCVDDNCGKIFPRHSNSINTVTHGCPCGGRLIEIDADGNPKLRKPTDASTPAKKRSEWQDFLAKEGPVVRKEVPGIKSEEVFKVVAERWKAVKGEAAAKKGHKEVEPAPAKGESPTMEDKMKRLGLV
ncbi:hypothetical protein ACM66B_002618 [Microbotryomycetes sp. NB124-2]